MASRYALLLIGVVPAAGMAACPPSPAEAPQPPEDPADATVVTVISGDAAPSPPPAEPTGHPAHDPGVVEIASGDETCTGRCSGSTNDALTKAVQDNSRETRECFEKLLQSDPSRSGKLLVLLRVGSSGETCSVIVESDAFAPDTEFLACIEKKYQRPYPKPTRGCIHFRQPLVFQSPQTPGADSGA